MQPKSKLSGVFDPSLAPNNTLMRECYTALDTMSLASRRRRGRSIVQAPLEDALVERTAEDMPQELSSGQSWTGDFL